MNSYASDSFGDVDHRAENPDLAVEEQSTDLTRYLNEALVSVDRGDWYEVARLLRLARYQLVLIEEGDQ